MRGVMLGGARPPQIVVWPEEPAPFYYYRDPQFHQAIDRLARAAHAYLLIGTVAWTRAGSPPIRLCWFPRR